MQISIVLEITIYNILPVVYFVDERESISPVRKLLIPIDSLCLVSVISAFLAKCPVFLIRFQFTSNKLHHYRCVRDGVPEHPRRWNELWKLEWRVPSSQWSRRHVHLSRGTFPALLRWVSDAQGSVSAIMWHVAQLLHESYGLRR